MDAATRRLLNAVLAYLEDAPRNVSNDLLKNLEGISSDIIDSQQASEEPSPGQLAVAHSIGKDKPEPIDYRNSDEEKSPGQREAEGITAGEV